MQEVAQVYLSANNNLKESKFPSLESLKGLNWPESFDGPFSFVCFMNKAGWYLIQVLNTPEADGRVSREFWFGRESRKIDQMPNLPLIN